MLLHVPNVTSALKYIARENQAIMEDFEKIYEDELELMREMEDGEAACNLNHIYVRTTC